MSTPPQFSSKTPTLKRILKEASELASQPSPDYHAAPLETDLFEWHFTLRGPPAPSPFAEGLYHGRIVLPPAYPLKPPSFRFLTPTGRFEVNREICLSISGHHEETWQPAWGIRTALVAIRSFMDSEARGQLGGMDASEGVRRRLAGASRGWRCGVCGRANEVVMTEQDAAVREAGGKGGSEVVPEGLRLAYREDLEKAGGGADGKVEEPVVPQSGVASSEAQPVTTAPAAERRPSQPEVRAQTAQLAQQQVRQDEGVPPWIDKAIYGIVAALIFLLWKKIGG